MEPSITSGIYYFFIMAAVLLFASYIQRKSSFYKNLSSVEPKTVADISLNNRHEVLDGLRGFLALGVLFQHAVTNLAYFKTGIWQITDVRFFRHAGGEAVILFFMITSFLYWSKAISAKGKIDTKRLYKSRFFRLAPMYLFSALLVTISALVQTDFNIVSWSQFLKDIGSWLTFGLITTKSVNGVSIIPINAGIHWTLHYEWIFYLLLPVTAVMLRDKYKNLLIIPLVIAVMMTPDWGYWIIFFFGMFAAHVVRKYPVVNWVKSNAFSIVPLLGFVVVYLMQYKPYSTPQYVVTFFMLLSFIYGNSLWGLLKTRAAFFLGTISYSMYLIHGIVLFVVLNFANTITPVAELGAIMFWSLILLAALLTVLTSAFTYKYIEYPFLKKS